jgi:hypothetical protein
MVPIATLILNFKSLLLLLMTIRNLMRGAKTSEEKLNHAVHFNGVV